MFNEWFVVFPFPGLVVWFFFKLDWLIDWWLCWVFTAPGLCSCCGEVQPLFITLNWPLTGVDSLVAEHLLGTGSFSSSAFLLSCSAECGSFLDLILKPCPFHQQADPERQENKGSPTNFPVMCFIYGLYVKHFNCFLKEPQILRLFQCLKKYKSNVWEAYNSWNLLDIYAK